MESHVPTEVNDTTASTANIIEGSAANIIEDSTANISEGSAADTIEDSAANTIEKVNETTITTVLEDPTANINGDAAAEAMPTVPITTAEVEPPKRITLVHEVITEVSTCIMFNDKTFNRPCQANLKNNNSRISPTAFALPTYEQECFRGQFSMIWTGVRAFDPPNTKPSEKMNPVGIRLHTLKIDISSLDIEDFTIVNATKYGPLPEAFGCQTTDPEADNYFDATDKAFITFRTKKLNVTGTHIPCMHITACTSLFKSLSDEILSAKRQKDPMFKFFLVINNASHRMKMFAKLKTKFIVDKALDPLKAWVKNSPNKQLLMIGNILRPHEFPPVSKEGWVIANKTTWQDQLEAHVHQIYAVTCEHNLFKGRHTEWKATSFDTTFAAMPGTSFKNNEFDNDYPKMFLLHVDWKDSKLNRPKAGDIVNVRLPFDVPDCPEYKGEDAKRPLASAQDFNDDGTFREDFDDDEQEAAEVRREISAEARAEEELRQLQTWMGSVQQVDKYTPANTLPIVIFRRVDFRFRGPEGCERRVDTEIPSHNTNFRNLERLRMEFAKAPKFSVSIEPSYSERTYRDLVRNLNSFFQLQSDEFAAPANVHLAEYFLAFDDTLEYPITNFFNEYAPKDWEKMCDRLSVRQKDSLLNGASQIHHAYLRIQGVVASAKSRMSMLMVAMMIAKNNEEKRTKMFNALIIQETNVGVDHLALELTEELQRHNVEATVIRLGSLPTENAKFNAKILKPHFIDNFHDDDKETEMWIASRHLYDIAKSTNNNRKAGDKRFAPSVKNLTLYEAMWRKVHAERESNPHYAALLEKLEFIQNNPADDTVDWPHIRTLRKKLLQDTLASADAVVATSGQALRTTAQQAVPEYTVMVLDEGGKRTPATTCALIGAYRISGFIIDNGDPIQMGVFCESASNPEYWNMFQKVLTTPILTKTGQTTLHGMFLDEQFRMHTPILTSFINHNFYHGQMVDAVKSVAPSANVKFFKDLFSDKLGVAHNFVVVIVKESKSFIESGGNSIYNPATQHFAIELMQEAVRRLQSAECTADRDMTLANITPYKAEATMVQTEINHRGLKNCDALVSEVVQGIGRNGVFLTLPNAQRLTEFGTEPRRLLVELTRHREGLAIIIPDGALEYENYGFSSEAEMYRGPMGKVKSLVDMAKAQGVCVEMPAPDTSQCFQCGQKGHTKSTCTVSEKEHLPPQCWNCLERGHDARECKDERDEALRPQVKKDAEGNLLNGKSCRRCGSTKHLKFEVSGCKKCNSCEHRGDACPLLECKICKEKGHMAQHCPKRQPCKNCGGDHSNRNCNVPKKPLTRGNLSNYPVKPDTIEEDEDDVDEQGFSIEETNETVQKSIVSAQSLPGVPMEKLQEEMMIAYAKDLSLKDTPIIPDKVERLDITDMSFYHSGRATEAFQNKDTSIEAIFTVPARKEGQVSSPLGDEVVIELPHNKFVKGVQWQEKKTGKQYATWWEKVPFSSFRQDASCGYTYVADFDVVSVTAAKDFEDRHVIQIEEVDEEIDQEVEEADDQQGNGDGWGGAVVHDEGKLEVKETSWGQGANEWGSSQGASQSGAW